MSGLTPVFVAGKPISAAALEDVRMNASRVGHSPDGLGGAAMEVGDITPLTEIRVAVVARSVSEPAVLEAHQYAVSDGVSRWDIDHTRLIVGVEPALLIADTAPDGKPMGFWPASVAGEGDAEDAPWRAWGILYRGPGATVNTSDYAVRLFGLCVARGC